jgi:hypothetical protein
VARVGSAVPPRAVAMTSSKTPAAVYLNYLSPCYLETPRKSYVVTTLLASSAPFHHSFMPAWIPNVEEMLRALRIRRGTYRTALHFLSWPSDGRVLDMILYSHLLHSSRLISHHCLYFDNQSPYMFLFRFCLIFFFTLTWYSAAIFAFEVSVVPILILCSCL